MKQIESLILPMVENPALGINILSCSVYSYIARCLSAAGLGSVFGTGDLALHQNGVTCLCDTADAAVALDAFLQQPLVDGAQVLIVLQPAPCLTPKTISALVSSAEDSGASVLSAGDTPIALFAPWDKLSKLSFNWEELSAMELCKALVATMHYAPREEGHIITDTASIYAAQENLRSRINSYWLESGVLLIDPMTTHISPLAKIGEGTVVLPGCLIYGSTVIGESCKIGPNTYLSQACLGNGVSVNSSQIFESTVGDNTTVGPFAYIRPGCQIGEKVKIGDFVELKKSIIGDGTKISHLTYIGDSELGKRINIGCGVVTVNYDGKKKFKTVVGDDSFVGCNVNLISPVTIGSGAYVAAGTTITEDVPADSLAVGRARQVVKVQWAKKRREDGKL